MNVKRLIRRRRAVSPILAAILLIGLAVAAGAVLFTVVMPLIDSPGGSLVFVETDADLTATNLHLVLKNEATETVKITNITIGGSEVNNFNTFTILKAQGAFKDYAGNYTGTYTIKVSFELDDATQTPIEIDLTVT